MKEVKVRYLLDHKSKGEIHIRYLLETLEDVLTALENKFINELQLKGILQYIVKGEKVILNDKGGYCGMDGVWAFA